jgi:Domain of unknown function (DUF4386)
MTTPKTLARIAGLLFLIVAACTMFAELYVRSRIVKPGDATATADNIRASAALFRSGLAIDLVGATFFLLTAMALYLLLKDVNQPIAAAMVTLVAVSVAISCLNLLNQYTALRIATSQDYTRAFGKAGSDTLALLFTDMQRNGGLINTMFFGLWLLPLGWLVIKSGHFPDVLGVLLVLGCFGWLTLLFANFLAPDHANNIAPFVDVLDGIAELSFVAWLLAIGVRASPPQKGLPALAHPGHSS